MTTRLRRIPGTGWVIDGWNLLAVGGHEGWQLLWQFHDEAVEGWLADHGLSGVVFSTRRSLVESVESALETDPRPALRVDEPLRRVGRGRYETRDRRWTVSRAPGDTVWEARGDSLLSVFDLSLAGIASRIWHARRSTPPALLR